MLLQDFLRGGGTYTELLSKYAIKHTRHKKYPNLVLFKYNQIDSPMGDPMVQECRGVILDEHNDYAVVCRPFDKFFNYGEGHAKPVDWTTAEIQEKLDGSLATIYFYDGSWHIATSGTPDASGEVNGFGFTFAQLFWSVFVELGYDLPDEDDSDYSFMFELMTKYNRVVVPHPTPELKLIGVRHRVTMQERRPEWMVADGVYNWQVVKSFPLYSIDEVLASFDKINPLSQEGYVVTDHNFNRIKVKHPGYVALHQMRDGLHPRAIVELVRKGETDEVVAYFPEWKDMIDDATAKLNVLIFKTDELYRTISHVENQKQFALLAVNAPIPDALFRMRQGKVASWKQYFAEMRIEHLMSVMGMKDNGLQENE
jgi:hypothetical protein